MQPLITRSIEETTGEWERSHETTRKVIQFPLHKTAEDISGSNISHIKTYLEEKEEKPEIAKAHPLRRSLDIAFHRIADVLDIEMESVERSNCFDEWKDLLEMAAQKEMGLTTIHRQILGTLIVVSKNRDICDFDMNTLRIFREGTVALRQPRLSKQDSKRIITLLASQKLKIAIPLAVDNLSQSNIDELDSMMAKILQKSHPNP